MSFFPLVEVDVKQQWCQKTSTIGKIMGPLGTKNAALDIPTRKHPALYLMKRKLEETEETGLPPCLF